MTRSHPCASRHPEPCRRQQTQLVIRKRLRGLHRSQIQQDCAAACMHGAWRWRIGACMRLRTVTEQVHSLEGLRLFPCETHTHTPAIRCEQVENFRFRCALREWLLRVIRGAGCDITDAHNHGIALNQVPMYRTADFARCDVKQYPIAPHTTLKSPLRFQSTINHGGNEKKGNIHSRRIIRTRNNSSTETTEFLNPTEPQPPQIIGKNCKPLWPFAINS